MPCADFELGEARSHPDSLDAQARVFQRLLQGGQQLIDMVGRGCEDVEVLCGPVHDALNVHRGAASQCEFARLGQVEHDPRHLLLQVG